MARFNDVNFIPFAVLGASLLGSGHCLAMCGGLVTTLAQGKNAILRYHLGRLLGYSFLGALAGGVGKSILSGQSQTWMGQISAVLLALAFFYLGARLWTGKSLHFFRLPQSFWRLAGSAGPEVSGLLSAFLPCGWLHAFVLGAVATRSPLAGALYLAFFWLGTLPALSFAPFAVRRLFRPIAQRVPRLSAVILISIGLASLGVKIIPASMHEGGDCPFHHQDTQVP